MYREDLKKIKDMSIKPKLPGVIWTGERWMVRGNLCDKRLHLGSSAEIFEAACLKKSFENKTFTKEQAAKELGWLGLEKEFL